MAWRLIRSRMTIGNSSYRSVCFNRHRPTTWRFGSFLSWRLYSQRTVCLICTPPFRIDQRLAYHFIRHRIRDVRTLVHHGAVALFEAHGAAALPELGEEAADEQDFPFVWSEVRRDAE